MIFLITNKLAYRIKGYKLVSRLNLSRKYKINLSKRGKLKSSKSRISPSLDKVTQYNTNHLTVKQGWPKKSNNCICLKFWENRLRRTIGITWISKEESMARIRSMCSHLEQRGIAMILGTRVEIWVSCLVRLNRSWIGLRRRIAIRGKFGRVSRSWSGISNHFSMKTNFS